MTRPTPTTFRMLFLAAGVAATTAAGSMLSAQADSRSASLPVPAYAGGTKAITLTPVVGTPRRQYPEMFLPGEEELADGEMRVTVLGSGNPWVTRAQAAASILVEVGNAERDLDRKSVV